MASKGDNNPRYNNHIPPGRGRRRKSKDLRLVTLDDMTATEIKPCVHDAFSQMKKTHDLEYVTLVVTKVDETSSISLAEKGEIKAVTSEQHFQTFVSSLPEKECRLVLYNFRFVMSEGESEMNKIFLIIWCPDEAPVLDMQIYPGMRTSLRRQLSGISFDVIAHHRDHLDYDVINRQVRGQ